MFGRGPKIKPRSGFNDATTEAFLEVIQDAFDNIQNYAGSPAIRASVGGTKMQKHLNSIRQLATKMMDESIKFDNEYMTWKNEDLDFNMNEETDLEEDEELEERTRAGDAARVAGTVAGYEVGRKAGGDIGGAAGRAYSALAPTGTPGKYSAPRLGRQIGGGIAGKAAGAYGGYMAGDEVAYRAQLEQVEDLSTPVETLSLTEEAVKDIKKQIQRKYKKGDQIRYIDARDHEERTGKYKGLKYMGGRSYAQVETGKELLALPVFQIVLD